MGKLTKEEKTWVGKINKLLAACPTKRIAFATTGDRYVTLFDVNRYNDICDTVDSGHGDFIPTAERLGAVFDECLVFPNQVESTAG